MDFVRERQDQDFMSGASGADRSALCRHTAVKNKGRVLLHLKNGPLEPEVVSVPKHKKYPPAGTKATTRTRVSTRLHNICLCFSPCSLSNKTGFEALSLLKLNAHILGVH